MRKVTEALNSSSTSEPRPVVEACLQANKISKTIRTEKMRKYLPIQLQALLIGLSLPISVYAGTAYSNETVKTVHVNADTGIFFKIDGEMVDLDGCGSSVGYRIAPDSNYEKEALSLLLAARMSKSRVGFSIVGCSGTYPKVNYINTYD